MPWLSEYPPMSPERAAQIRAEVEEDYEARLLAWEAELRAQIRWYYSTVTWVIKFKEDIPRKKKNPGLTP
jgi:hypothetical protein